MCLIRKCKDCGRTLNCQLPFWSSEADNEIWGFRMDRATMQKYIDVSLQHSEDLDAFGSCICTIMAATVSEERWFFSKQWQNQIESWNDFANLLTWGSEVPIWRPSSMQNLFPQEQGLACEGHRVLNAVIQTWPVSASVWPSGKIVSPGGVQKCCLPS